MNTCVSDDKIIVNIQGIRNVTWGLSTYTTISNAHKPWVLMINYKGSQNIFYYETEFECREIFNKIREAMSKTRDKQ